MPCMFDRIRAARRQAHLSQAELAQLLNIQRSSIAHWERRGGTLPTSKNLATLVNVTGVSFEWLATGRGTMRPLSFSGTEDLSDRLAYNDDEAHLLLVFRSMRPAFRNNLLELISGMRFSASPKRSRPRRVAQTAARHSAG